jgi:hypothetical protein
MYLAYLSSTGVEDTKVDEVGVIIFVVWQLREFASRHKKLETP